MIDNIYNALIADNYIKDQVFGRIKYYEYPETGNVDKPYIVIDPIDVPLPKDFADGTWLTNDFLYQIEVWSKDRLITQEISSRIRHVMWSLGFGQGSGVDEYDKGIFRNARRYRGKAYRDDFNTL